MILLSIHNVQVVTPINPPWPIGYYASGVTILAGMWGATGGVWVEVDENYIRYTDSAYLEGYNFPKA